MLTFDDPTHTYRYNGVVVPGVTSLLRPIHDFSKIPPDILADAQHRGTYCHKMTELYDLGNLDEQANAQVEQGRYIGYLRAWKEFLEDYRPDWWEIEHMDYSRRYNYCGTWDRRGTLNGKRRGRFLIDIKTANDPHDPWGVQTAAYRQIAAEQEISAATDNRATVQLHADGNYKFLEWTDPTDWDCFHALIVMHNWKEKHK